MTKQPQLSFWQIWNMCFGFMGIQFGFALQNANVSRIFQTLGADYNNMTLLWVAAPITGLVVQPIVGYFSDRTWGKLGRRRPYFLYGALLSTAALFVMPNSPSLWIAAGTLWILDASINVSMEPFRALVGDVLPPEQRGFGYAMQSFFIGIGAVVASALPWMMTNWFDVSNTADAGAIPESVKLSFYAGGLIFLAAVSWTVFTTKEYAPEEMASFFEDSADESATSDTSPAEASTYTRRGVTWLLVGLIATLVIDTFSDILDRNLYILSLGIAVFGLCQLAASRLITAGKTDHGFVTVLHDLFNMPGPMRKLAAVQFFSWFPLFAMWTSTTAAVTSYHFNTTDPTSGAYNQGADWVGLLFSTYNVVAMLFAILIPIMVRKMGLKRSHMVNLFCGGLGFISFVIIQDPFFLLVSMVGVGMAWASILSLPYALLSTVIPYQKMGLFMGIFNFFIVLPQILAASILGIIVGQLFGGEPVYALVVGGVSMLIAGLLTMRVEQPE
ncbi:MAG TPA: MFS transporter [Halieaceae bacterium]|nr:MFS transporter [Halieaceae bacterium]